MAERSAGTRSGPQRTEACFLAERSEGFREVLQFEADNPQILEPATPRLGVSFWHVVRFALCRLMGDALHGTHTARTRAPAVGPADRLRYAWRCTVSNPWRARARHSRILFFSSAIGNVRRDGVYFNRLCDSFAAEFAEETTVLESPHDSRYFFPRAHAQTYCLGAFGLASKLRRRFAAQPVGGREQPRQFVAHLAANFGRWVDARGFDRLEALLRSRLVEEAATYDLYSRLLDRLRPRLLVLEDACYGGLDGVIRLAKVRGINVAEYQHGLVSRNHEAYNYHPRVLAALAPSFPDSFLAYGRYWAEQISIPPQIEVIGNPYLSEALAARRASATTVSGGRGTHVLLVAGGLDPELYARVVAEFLACAPEPWRVTLRPHPSRRALAEEDYGRLAGTRRVEIDVSADYYASLESADYVVGDASTAVMEAAAFGRPVFLIDHVEVRRNYPGVFPVFSSGAELLARLTTERDEGGLPDAARIWAEGWRHAYRDFVRRAAGL